MPLVFVQRWVAPSGPVTVTGGTQTVTGTLDISAGVTVVYDGSLFRKATYPEATYTLFNFGSLNPASPVDVNTYFSSEFDTSGYSSAVYAIVGNSITVTLS